MSAHAPRPVRVGGTPRVNLLPTKEVTRRANVALGRRWARIVLLALGVVAVVVVGLHAMNLFSVTRLASEQLRTQTLMTEIADLAPVSQAMSARASVQTQREQAMAGDLAWRPVLDTLKSGMPEGAAITGYELTAGPALVEEDPTAGVGLTGTVTLSSATPVELVTATAKLRALEPVTSIDVQSLARDDETNDYEYVLTVVLDQTIYTGDFAAATAKQEKK